VCLIGWLRVSMYVSEYVSMCVSVTKCVSEYVASCKYVCV